MKKWGIRLVGLSIFGLATLSACSKPTTSQWYESFCKERASCGFNCGTLSTSKFQTQYDTSADCRSKTDSFRACAGDSPGLCGSGSTDCGTFTEAVLVPCGLYCNDGTCDAGETASNCPADCASS
jgi:hypothetical protein